MYHVGRHIQRHRKVACLPTHWIGVKNVRREKPWNKLSNIVRILRKRKRLGFFRRCAIKSSCRTICFRCAIRCGTTVASLCRCMTRSTIWRTFAHPPRTIPIIHRIYRCPQSSESMQPMSIFNAVVEKVWRKKGYPRYKSSVRSLTWELRKYKLKNARVRQQPIRETGTRQNLLKVPKLGEVKIRQHRPLCRDPKEVTLKKTARGWYCFSVTFGVQKASVITPVTVRVYRRFCFDFSLGKK